MKILIIDDNQGDINLIKIMLKEAGISAEIITADTGEVGISQAKEYNPEIVIIDTGLPKINGIETCAQIQKLPNFTGKIIIMTGNIDLVNYEAAIKAGTDEYSVKTSDYLDLLSKINKLINR